MTEREWGFGADIPAAPGENMGNTHECRRCEATINTKEGELRQRVTFEDFAKSTASYAQFRLCNPCWWAIYDAAHGDRPVGPKTTRERRSGGDDA